MRISDWSSDVCSSETSMAVLLSTPSTSIPGIRSKAGRTDPAPPWGAGARYFSGLLLVRAPFSLAVGVAGSELPVDDVAEHGFGIGRPRVAIDTVLGMPPHHIVRGHACTTIT